MIDLVELNTNENHIYCILRSIFYLTTFCDGAKLAYFIAFLMPIIYQIPFSHLLSNGFVNPIPKQEPVKGGDQKAGFGEGCGFGEGDLTADATDVSAQVENMEQIEGLKVFECFFSFNLKSFIYA